MGGIMLLSCSRTTISFQSGSQAFAFCWQILLGPCKPETQRLYRAIPAAGANRQNRRAMPDPVGGTYYQKVYNFADVKRGLSRARIACARLYDSATISIKHRRRGISARQRNERRDRAADGLPMSMPSKSIRPSAFLGTSITPRAVDDPALHCRFNDARNFFRTADQKYDLIVYGRLDSHAALSHASSLR